MKTKFVLLIGLIIFNGMFLPNAYGAPTVEIIMENTTFRYCERLFYTIQVSEVTGDPAIIHIRDQTGKESSAIPIPISNLQNPIPSVVPFEASIFPVGKYFIDVEYSGAKNTAEFDLIESEKICISVLMKQIAYSWVNGQISDGFLIDAITKFVDEKVIKIPYQMTEKNIEEIHIPKWVKNVTIWWLEDKISDMEFSKAIQYLVDREIIII